MARVWMNGRLRDESEAVVRADDRGFTLADGLFETMRAYEGTVFRLQAHMDRLRRGAQRIGLELPDGLEEAVRDVLTANDLQSAVVRLTVSRGTGGDGLLPPTPAAPTLVVTAKAYAPAEAWDRSGIRAIVARTRVNEHAATAGLKRPGCFGDYVVARLEARDAGCEEALLLDTAGHLAEATACNLFVLVDRVLFTPALTCGPLPGITRAAVIELAPRIGLEVREVALDPDVLTAANEAFLTNSLRELVPLIGVDDVRIGPGHAGAVTMRLLDEYRQLIRSEMRP